MRLARLPHDRRPGHRWLANNLYMYEHGQFWEAQLATEPTPAFETALPIAV